jgi:hypothetical protein
MKTETTFPDRDNQRFGQSLPERFARSIVSDLKAVTNILYPKRPVQQHRAAYRFSLIDRQASPDSTRIRLTPPEQLVKHASALLGLVPTWMIPSRIGAEKCKNAVCAGYPAQTACASRGWRACWRE